MTWFLEGIKFCINDFPTHDASMIVGVVLLAGTGIIVMGRLAMGEPLPVGYDPWLLFLASVVGFNAAGMMGKRLAPVPQRAPEDSK